MTAMGSGHRVQGFQLHGAIWGILFLFSGQAHAFLCENVFSTKSVSISEQVRLVKTYETASHKQDPQTHITNYSTFEKMLMVYKTTIGQVRTGMNGYIRRKNNLDSAFENYLASRMALLTDQQRGMLDQVVPNASWSNSKKIANDENEDDFAAAYIPAKKLIHFKMPESYKGTLVHAFLFAHEMEHAIQHIRLLKSFTNHDVEISDRATDELKYLSELGAMTAEWTFLQGISDHEIAAALDQVKSAKDIEASYKVFFLRALSNSKLPLDEYINREHQAGRYSHEFFQP